ncbi:MAG: heme exporter protein CcmB, partial [Mesorhizobium sp.]
VLILPLVIPVLIFGVSAAYALQSPTDAFLPPVMILGASTLFFAVLGPLAAGAALRWSGD